MKTDHSAALILVFGLALLVRVRFWLMLGGVEPSYLQWADTNYFGGVSIGYVEPAEELARGLFPTTHDYPPLYPLFLAFFRGLGVELQHIRVVQAVLDSGAALLLFSLLQRIGAGVGASLAGASLYALMPPLAAGAVVIMGEALVPAATIVVMYTMVRAMQEQRPLDWMLLGLAGLIPALCRSELIVVIAPLIVWALLTAAKGPRRRAALLVASAFALPCLAIASIHMVAFGDFALAQSALFYVLHSGLGQFPNELGYYADDMRAAAELQAHGLTYQSAGAEAYWRAGYLNAWAEHPGHIWASSGRRIILILTQSDQPYLSSFATPARSLGLALVIGGGVVLARRTQWALMLVLIGPMLVAVASLGFVYVEPRYVRYAMLTYIIGAAFSISGLAAAARPWLDRHKPARL